MSVATEISEYPFETIDVTKITKKILSSNPPFGSDLEDQVKYAKVWGGGKGQLMTKDVCNFIKMMPDCERVKAEVFFTLACVKLDPTKLPHNFMPAFVKCAASRHVNENSLRVGKREAMAIKDKLATVMEADEYIKRAKELCGTRSDLPLNELVLKRGKLECDLVCYIFEKYGKKEKKPDSMVAIVEEFVNSLGEHTPANQATTDGQAETGATMIDETNMFDTVLSSKGITKGGILVPVGGNPMTQYEIAYINDDGSVGLYNVLRDGSVERGKVIKVVDKASLTSYKPVDKKYKLKQLDFPSKAVTAPTEGIMYYQSIANIAVNRAYKPCAHIYIQAQPAIGVYVKRDIAKDQLTLVAWSPWVALVKPNKNKELVGEQMDTTVHVGGGHTFETKRPAGLGDTIEVEFWRLKKVADKKKANMIMDKIEVKMPATITESKVTVPVAKLFKDVEANCELCLYVPVIEKKRRLEGQLESSKRVKGE